MHLKKVVVSVFAVCSLLSANIYSYAYEEPELKTFFVATDGNDTNIGTKDSPFATIERARDEIRKIKQSGNLPQNGVCVYVREGDYGILSSIEFTNEDSGTENNPITYRAYPGEKVSFYGGVKIDQKDMKKTNDTTVLDKIYNQSARTKIMELDLTKYGITEVPKVKWQGSFNHIAKNDNLVSDPSMELFVDGNAQTIARWPNSGYSTYSAVDDIVNKITEQQRITGEVSNYIIKFNDDRAFKWNDAKDALFYGFWDNDWADYILQLKEYTKGQLEFDGYNIFNPSMTRRFYVYNLLEELDSKGEFYADRDSKKLYYYPVDNYKNSDIKLSLLKEPMFDVKSSYLNFKGFDLGYTRGNIFNISGDNNTVSYCTLHSNGLNAIKCIGNNNGFLSNYIYDVNGGIDVSGGDLKTLTNGNNYCENNYFKEYARLTHTYTPAIHLTNIGNRATNNTITGADHLAIEFLGPQHMIEYNDFFDVLRASDDSGVIYTGGNKTWYGNVIRYNYIHDIKPNVDSSEGILGVYLDDSMDAADVYGNIFNNFKGQAFQFSGNNIVFRDNLIMNVDGSVARGVDWSNGGTRTDERWRKTITDNPYTTTGVWIEKYPQIKAMLDMDNVRVPTNNTITNNISINLTGKFVLASVFFETGKIDDPVIGKNSDVIVSDDGIKTKNSSSTYNKLDNFPVLDSTLSGVYAKNFSKECKNRIILGIGKGGAIHDGNVELIDEKNEKIMPFIENSNTMIPLRFVAEALGADVKWDADKQLVTIVGETKVELVIGERAITVNGVKKETDVSATIIGGRTFVPLRSVSEGLNKNVEWNERGLIIISDIDDEFDLSEYPEEYATRLLDEAIRQVDVR